MKEELLEYIYKHCQIDFLSDLRLRSVLKRNIDIIMGVDDDAFSSKDWRYFYEYITGLTLTSDSVPYIKDQLMKWICKAS